MYQRCRVRKCEVSCEFFIEQEFFYENKDQVTSLVSNSDYYLVGMFLTQQSTAVPPIVSPFDWERLQRTGNCVYRRYVKNVSGPLRVTATVGIAAALQYTDQADVNVRVYPTANIGTSNARITASYPNLANLYVTVFVVPQTRTLGASTPLQVNYRMSTKKWVTFSKPLSDVYQTYNLDQYPPYSTSLPTGFEPRTIDDARDLEQDERLDELEARMDLDDNQDEVGFDGLRANDNQHFVRLDELEAGQIVQDQNLVDHELLEGKAAH